MDELKTFKVLTILLAIMLGLCISRLIATNMKSQFHRENLRVEHFHAKSLASKKTARKKDNLKTVNRQQKLPPFYNEIINDSMRKSALHFKTNQQDISLMLEIRKELEGNHVLLAISTQQLAQVRVANEALQKENSALKNLCDNLKQNSLLTHALLNARLTEIDNIQLQAVKRRQSRLTTRSACTKKLIGNFKTSIDFRNLTYKILGPQGEIIHEVDGVFASRVLGFNETLFASSSLYHLSKPSIYNVEVVFTPRGKLEPGTYKIEIWSNYLYIKSLQIKLE